MARSRFLCDYWAAGAIEMRPGVVQGWRQGIREDPGLDFRTDANQGYRFMPWRSLARILRMSVRERCLPLRVRFAGAIRQRSRL